MFDVGFSELLLTAVVALLVLGPERLPRAAKLAGLWVRRARASWYSVRSQFERELADDELKRSLQATRKEFDGLRGELQRPFELEHSIGGSRADTATGAQVSVHSEPAASPGEPAIAEPAQGEQISADGNAALGPSAGAAKNE